MGFNRKEEEEEPPAWALNLLQNMGRYVFNSGNVFRTGDYLDANGPICLDSDTQLTALAFVHDPELSTIDTPNGRVQFLQMIGITGDELESMQTWNAWGTLVGVKVYAVVYNRFRARFSAQDSCRFRADHHIIKNHMQ
ncbi:hypothetical protein J2TS4_09740 [Paenibacillus sp. J2TS4]|nr:hypothetical protein J2TS4_09740 [Paenibacillus sp. J2TS4]